MTVLTRRIDLKPHEQFRLWRLRAGLDRKKAAKALKRTVHWIGSADRGQIRLDPGSVPWLGNEDLTEVERCLVHRWRSGRTQASIAADLGVSRLWVNKMERGAVGCRQLIQYWEN